MKNYIKTISLVAVAAVLTMNVAISLDSNNKTKLNLGNIDEALAQASEGGTTTTYYCWKIISGGIAFPRQCPSCVPMWFASGSDRSTCTITE